MDGAFLHAKAPASRRDSFNKAHAAARICTSSREFGRLGRKSVAEFAVIVVFECGAGTNLLA
jgi:hypothetical protein